MSRLSPFDRALVLILAPLWLAWFGLGVRTQVDDGGMAAMGVSLEEPDGLPVVNGEFSTLYTWDPLERAGLRPGDRLVQLGEAHLRGVGNVGFAALAAEQQEGRSVVLVYERDGERHETSLALLPVSLLRPWLAGSLAFALSALVMVLRARPTPTVRCYLHAALCMAFGSCLAGTSRLEVYGTLAMLVGGGTIGFPLWIRFASHFPESRAPGGAWNRVWPWLFCMGGVFNAIAYIGGRYGVANPGIAVNAVLSGAAILTLAARNYRRGDAIARRQMRWVVVGGYFAVFPIVIGTALALADPRFGALLTLSYWGVPLFPLFMLIAVMGFNLFDVDRLLSAGTTYNVLGVLFVGAGLVLVPRGAEAASELLNVDPATGQLALSLALAGLLVPAQRRLRPQIERLFFSERYALDQGIGELLRELSAPEAPESLARLTGERLHQLLRPESCVIYTGDAQGYAPVFEKGAVVPPGFEPDSLLVETLRERREALALDGTGRRADAATLGPVDRAALATMGAAVVVPVLRGGVLAAFLCLGPKRSGDVYTSTDLALLSAVATTLSNALLRIDQEDLARQSRTLQESLRRYVPGAVADELASGTELSSGEREISVLFVDIRGYTSFSESRQAEEIFSTVNRYTELVSTIVRKHAGSVVEFNGDGMMAVFGAPRELAHKERAAVEAGCEIGEAVAALAVEDRDGGQTTLSVGVGIATGVEFVGNIRAADRMIWTAIGNTTNLAARLQSLTRELEAKVVIDGETWARAQPAAAAFEKRPGVPIRGRRETQDVYALPLG